MQVSKRYPLELLDLDEVCEMIADDCSLAQIGTKFERCRRVSLPRTQENLVDFTLEDISSPAKNNPHRRSLRPIAISPREWEPDIPTFAAPRFCAPPTLLSP